MAIMFARLETLDHEDKIMRAMQRIEKHIEFTPQDELLKMPSNLKGLTHLYSNYALCDLGSDPFWRKMETLLIYELENKKYKLEHNYIMDFIDGLARKKCVNEQIWKPILLDLD